MIIPMNITLQKEQLVQDAAECVTEQVAHAIQSYDAEKGECSWC